MAKPPVIEDAQMRHAFKVAAVTGQTPARDVALLHVLYGTGMDPHWPIDHVWTHRIRALSAT